MGYLSFTQRQCRQRYAGCSHAAAAAVLLLLARPREGLGNRGGVVVVTDMVETLSVQKIKKTVHLCSACSSAAVRRCGESRTQGRAAPIFVEQW